MLRNVKEVWADECCDFQKDDSTPLLQFFEERKHFIIMEYNKLDSKELTEKIEIDDRLTIKELRKVLGEKLGVDPMSFILYKNENKELKKLEKKVCYYYIRD